MSRPPLHALQGFVAAARSGNLSRAAESLTLTVSALSHQIRGLEERLGLRLFVRGARGVELTSDGRRLYDRVGAHYDVLEQALRPYRSRCDDVLTITLMPSFASRWLVPRLPRFLAAQPQLEINLQSSVNVVDSNARPISTPDCASAPAPGPACRRCTCSMIASPRPRVRR